MYASGHQSTELAISIKNKGEVKEIVHANGWGELLEWRTHFAEEQQDKILKSFLGDSLLQRDHQGELMDFGSCFCCKKTACFFYLTYFEDDFFSDDFGTVHQWFNPQKVAP